MIEARLELNQNDRVLIDRFLALAPPEQTAERWTEDDVAAFKARAKAHYIAEQDRRCCYCQQRFETTITQYGTWTMF